MEDDNVDVRVEIRVATFWRKLVGDAEYTRFDPKDMFRWYNALELMGPADIRELFLRRQVNRPMAVVQGLVDHAPHPPARLVQAWLEQHETRVRTGGYWAGLFGFSVLCFFLSLYMNGCMNLVPLNPLTMHPPASGAVVMSSPGSITASPAAVVPTSAPVPLVSAPSRAQSTAPTTSGSGVSAPTSTSGGQPP